MQQGKEITVKHEKIVSFISCAIYFIASQRKLKLM